MAGVLLCSLAHQALKGAAWVGSYSAVQCWRVGSERLWWWLMTQQYCLASMAAWFSSTGISHHNLLSHIPLGHFLTVSSRPHPEIAPQFLHFSSQLLCLLMEGDLHHCLGYV